MCPNPGGASAQSTPRDPRCAEGQNISIVNSSTGQSKLGNTPYHGRAGYTEQVQNPLGFASGYL